MKRLSIALAVLLSLNLLTEAVRWLVASNLLPMTQLWLMALICVGIVALAYFSILEANPFYYLYQREAKVYALAGLAGFFLGLL